MSVKRGLVATVAATLLSALLVAPVSASPAAQSSTGPASRGVYEWPFAWDSIWNLPLATTARYEPFDTRATWLYLDLEDISINPGFPLKPLSQEDTGRRIDVHTDPELVGDGEWNNCASFLMDTPDKQTIVQGQPLKLRRGGAPSWRYSWEPVSLTGLGHNGCHGGSALSGLGGDIRRGDLPGDLPIRHALKIGLNCAISCSPAAKGFRWPATKADRNYQENYGGKNPKVNMGTLFALPPDTDLGWITKPDVRKVAEALKTYGGYVVDSTGGPPTNSLAMQRGSEHEFPNIDTDQMRAVFKRLAIVTNSTAQTPGGGTLTSSRLAECAPAFTDGTGGSPPNCGATGKLTEHRR